MDSRHESLERATLSQLIIVINNYIQENIDDIFSDNAIQDEIKIICKTIYDFLELDVDIEGILSKHNLLSIDMVLFPCLTHIIESKFHETKDYSQVIKDIQTIINPQADGLSQFNKKINEILNNYISHTTSHYKN